MPNSRGALNHITVEAFQVSFENWHFIKIRVYLYAHASAFSAARLVLASSMIGSTAIKLTRAERWSSLTSRSDAQDRGVVEKIALIDGTSEMGVEMTLGGIRFTLHNSPAAFIEGNGNNPHGSWWAVLVGLNDAGNSLEVKWFGMYTNNRTETMVKLAGWWSATGSKLLCGEQPGNSPQNRVDKALFDHLVTFGIRAKL